MKKSDKHIVTSNAQGCKCRKYRWSQSTDARDANGNWYS